MKVAKIVVSKRIITQNLPLGEEHDVVASADNLADLEGTILSEALAEDFPGAEIYVDIAIFTEATHSPNIEIVMYNEQDQLIQQLPAGLQQKLKALLEQGCTDLSWAVKRQ